MNNSVANNLRKLLLRGSSVSIKVDVREDVPHMIWVKSTFEVRLRLKRLRQLNSVICLQKDASILSNSLSTEISSMI
jgi:hypothetical protein